VASSYRKPKAIKIYGPLFNGWWDRVQILLLKVSIIYQPPNTATSSPDDTGRKTLSPTADKTIFVSHTADPGDLVALESLLTSQPNSTSAVGENHPLKATDLEMLCKALPAQAKIAPPVIVFVIPTVIAGRFQAQVMEPAGKKHEEQE
jgi:hypothetical protein